MQHQAFVIEAETEQGIEAAQAWVRKELDMSLENNPDIVVMRYGLFSVEDARRAAELAAGAPFAGAHKVVIIAASRAYHEAQNALLKLFEEPPPGTYLFFVLPSLGGLLPTLRSRVGVLDVSRESGKFSLPAAAEQFLKAGKEKRSALIKKLTSGKDEEERRENRDEAIAILNGVEAAARRNRGFTKPPVATLLSDIAILRGHLYDRSAPVRMILEHLSLVTPKDLV
ncbi:MAG: DNA polymerase III subunit delta' [Parcubacteria group bacterium Gr01-1014_49]|nr:MAG: DNA polymerase III subunit delta' [Parcubacteria group bacterium Gr01-1014_49]